MPYFKDLNILLIHIPKTGGTSIEDYFFKDSIRDIHSIYSIGLYPNHKHIKFNNHSLQHSTYLELYNNREYFGLKFDGNLIILTSIRHPYDRIMSDLFFFNMITDKSSKNDVVDAIKKFLNPLNAHKYDNHFLPQHLYLIDENGKIPEDIYILNQKTLTTDMQALGFIDFNMHTQTHAHTGIDYLKFLNKESIRIINEYYAKDFEYFGYKKA